MTKKFQIKSGSLIPDESEASPVLVYVNPDAQERKTLQSTFNMDEHTLSSALDPDEVSRIEVYPDHILIIWKRPTNYSGGDTFFFDVASIGFMLFKDHLVVIVMDDIQLVNNGMRHTLVLNSPLDVMLGILFSTIHHYMEHLKVIKMIARNVQEKINTSMENRHLIQMFNLSESLVYYENGINSNGVVLGRLRSHVEKTGLTPEVTAFIDDLIIENNQCFKQAEIYSTVFTGLMDARGSIVNNNMNLLLRNLTIINVVFLPLNLIASIGGMSEFTMMTHSMNWRFSYALLAVVMLVIGLLTAFLLKRMHFKGGPVQRPGRRLRKRMHGFI